MDQITIYLAGEIHSSWRKDFEEELNQLGVNAHLVGPQSVHDRSDSVGEDIVGEQPTGRFRDLEGARVNTLRSRLWLHRADLVVAYFGDEYRQWNSALDAGAAIAMGTPLLLVRSQELVHALKEADALASFTVENLQQAAEAVAYIFE